MTDKNPILSMTFTPMMRLNRIQIFAAAITMLFACSSLDPVCADLVTISVGDPIGKSDVDSSKKYVGIISQVAPLEIDGETVKFNQVPSGEAFQVGDLAGRDMDGHAGDRRWEYLLSLPGDAMIGTGFQDIAFSGHAFEQRINNLEGTDELTWELFLNGSTIAIDSASSGAGVDFNSLDVNLSNAGGATINEIRVVFFVNGFNSGNEAFATRGLLSATYTTAVPEPNSAIIFLTMASVFCLNRRIRSGALLRASF